MLSLLAISVASAQKQSYYYSGGEKIYLSLDPSAAIIQFKKGHLPSRQFADKSAGMLEEISFHDRKGRAILNFKTTQKSSLTELASDLVVDQSKIESISYAYRLDGDFRFWPTNQIVLQPKEGISLAAFSQLMKDHEAEYARTDFGTIVLRLKDMNKAVALANEIYESGLVKFSHPDFYAPVTHYDNPLKGIENLSDVLTPSDPLYPEQFQMNNTGQTLDGFAGANDADCNAPEAWDITLGASSITVAVIDDGVEAHEDLDDLLTGYTPWNGGNGSPLSNGAHGQACAGIIAADHNGIGVAGVAPNVNILPVNIFAGNESTQDLANAINWAVANGADVLSNSWGFPNTCTAQADNINNALVNAVTNGRGGKGCIVVFASGNGGQNCVDYPAWKDECIAVGAFGNDGIVSEYSNQGTALDIAAPSNDIRSSFFGNTLVGAGVRTIDREGSLGYASGNYTSTFGGTSAACPVVSGVAALVLSVNPNLTEPQVKNILYTSAIDMGANGRDDAYGHGRVNAFGAVVAAGGSSNNTAPVAAFSANPTSGTAPLLVSFDANASSDADGDNLTYSWDFGDGSTATGVSPSYTYNTTGSYTATLTVSDGQASDQTSTTITVNPSTPTNTPPVAAFSANPTSGTAPLLVSFDANASSDTDGDNLTYSWAFGDGNNATGVAPSHTYTAAGNYTAILTVSDGQATDQASTTITVSEPSGGGTDVISSNSFETGWEDWNDGGSNSTLVNSPSWSWDGNNSIRLRDNTSSSLTFSDPFNLSAYNTVEIEFYFILRGMESDDSFSLQYNDGDGWVVIANYSDADNLVNNTFYVSTISLNPSIVNLSNGASFRFVNNGSARNDRVYLDAITITGSASPSTLSLGEHVSTASLDLPQRVLPLEDEVDELTRENISVYPNMASRVLNISNLPVEANVEVYNSLGRKVSVMKNENTLNIKHLERGIYFIKIDDGRNVKVMRFIKE